MLWLLTFFLLLQVTPLCPATMSHSLSGD